MKIDEAMDDLKAEVSMLAIQNGVPFLVSGPNGEIYTANKSFCEMVGYSEVELRKMGWVDLSIKNDELQADQELSIQLMHGTIQEYNQWKAYKTRYGSPVPGQLLAIRYPQGKEKLEYCLCFFTPLVNGSRAALELTTEYIRTHAKVTKESTEAIAAMMTMIDTSRKRSKVRGIVDSVSDWAEENPKSFVTMLVILAALNPLPIIQNLITSQGWLPAQPVQIQIEDKKTGQLIPASEAELKSIGIRNSSYYAFTPEKETDEQEVGEDQRDQGSSVVVTKAGNRIIFAKRTHRNVSCGTSKSGNSDGRPGRSDSWSGTGAEELGGLRGISESTVKEF